MEIEADDFTTIAGLVINESGKVPQPGEQLTFRGLELEVLEADERRIGPSARQESVGGNANGAEPGDLKPMSDRQRWQSEQASFYRDEESTRRQ